MSSGVRLREKPRPWRSARIPVQSPEHGSLLTSAGGDVVDIVGSHREGHLSQAARMN